MKKGILIWVLGLLLSGCGAAPTYETLGDVLAGAQAVSPRAVTLSLPEGASLAAVETEQGRLYVCDGYEVTVQTLPGGDLSRTVRDVTGYAPGDLTMLRRDSGTLVRYDFAWTAAGEAGQLVARGAVLDDGVFHYVLTAQAPVAGAGEVRGAWNGIFDSFGLDQY